MPDQPAPTSRRAPPRDPSRPSLREIAERSAAAMPRSRPGAPRSVPASAPSRPAAGQPARDEENTGYVEVGELRALYLASTRPQPADVTSDDEATRAYCPVPPPSQTQLAYTRSEPPARAARVAAGRRASGVVIGAAIALAGIAASAVWVARTHTARMEAAAVAREAAVATAAPAADAPAEALPQPPAAEEQPVEATAPAAAQAATGEQGEIRLGELPSTSTKRDGSDPSTSAARGASAAANGAAPARGRPATGAAKAAAAPPPGKPSDLASAIAAAAAAGPATPPPPEPAAPAPAPAKAAPAAGGQEQPSQAAVRAAVNAVKGGAKACLAEADDATRASITFAPSGTVSNVGVSGWAADAGVAGCVKSALKGARVEPFAGPSFTVSVTLRP